MKLHGLGEGTKKINIGPKTSFGLIKHICHETCEKHDPEVFQIFLCFLGEFFDLCADTNLQERKKHQTLPQKHPEFCRGVHTHFWWESNLMQIYGSFDGFLLKRTVPFFGLVSRVLGSRLPSLIKPKPIARITYFQVTLLTRCITFYHGKSPFFTTIHHHFGNIFHICSFLPTTKQANLSFSGGMTIPPSGRHWEGRCLQPRFSP